MGNWVSEETMRAKGGGGSLIRRVHVGGQRPVGTHTKIRQKKGQGTLSERKKKIIRNLQRRCIKNTRNNTKERTGEENPQLLGGARTFGCEQRRGGGATALGDRGDVLIWKGCGRSDGFLLLIESKYRSRSPPGRQRDVHRRVRVSTARKKVLGRQP